MGSWISGFRSPKKGSTEDPFRGLMWMKMGRVLWVLGRTGGSIWSGLEMGREGVIRGFLIAMGWFLIVRLSGLLPSSLWLADWGLVFIGGIRDGMVDQCLSSKAIGNLIVPNVTNRKCYIFMLHSWFDEILLVFLLYYVKSDYLASCFCVGWELLWGKLSIVVLLVNLVNENFWHSTSLDR